MDHDPIFKLSLFAIREIATIGSMSAWESSSRSTESPIKIEVVTMRLTFLCLLLTCLGKRIRHTLQYMQRLCFLAGLDVGRRDRVTTVSDIHRIFALPRRFHCVTLPDCPQHRVSSQSISTVQFSESVVETDLGARCRVFQITRTRTHLMASIHQQRTT